MSLKKRSMALRFNANLPAKISVNTKLFDGTTVSYQLLSLPIYLIGQVRRLLGDLDIQQANE